MGSFNITIMMIFYYCFIISLYLQACVHKSLNKSETNLTGFSLTYNMPVVNIDGSITEIKSKSDIYYYGNIRSYRLYYQFDSSVDGRNLLREERSRFFIFHKDSLWGRSYENNQQQTRFKEREFVDSILKRNIFESDKFDTLQNKLPDSLYNDSEGSLVKIFTPTVSDSFPEQFKLVFYYNKKFLGLKESFSRAMDNIVGLKLFKISIQAKGLFYKQYNLQFPQREYLMEAKELTIGNKEEIIKYIKRYITNKTD